MDKELGMFRWLRHLFAKAPLGPPDGYEYMHSFETTLAGANKGRDRQSEIHRLSAGDVVVLKREPKNPVDRNAIAVITSKSRMIGYIPAHIAVELAQQLDDGCIATADIVEMLSRREEFQFENCLIEVHLYRKPSAYTAAQRANASHHQAEMKHITDLVEAVRQLKRDAKFPEAERLLLKECDRQESESGEAGVAPWCYEQLAIIYRKTQRKGDEVSILERYEGQLKAPGVKPAELHARLEKARSAFTR